MLKVLILVSKQQNNKLTGSNKNQTSNQKCEQNRHLEQEQFFLSFLNKIVDKHSFDGSKFCLSNSPCKKCSYHLVFTRFGYVPFCLGCELCEDCFTSYSNDPSREKCDFCEKDLVSLFARELELYSNWDELCFPYPDEFDTLVKEYEEGEEQNDSYYFDEEESDRDDYDDELDEHNLTYNKFDDYDPFDACNSFEGDEYFYPHGTPSFARGDEILCEKGNEVIWCGGMRNIKGVQHYITTHGLITQTYINRWKKMK